MLPAGGHGWLMKTLKNKTEGQAEGGNQPDEQGCSKISEKEVMQLHCVTSAIVENPHSKAD